MGELSAHLILPGDPLRFATVWESQGTGEWVVREGTVGRAGRLTETGQFPASTELGALTAPFLDRGYVPRNDDKLDWVVVQFPLRTAAYDRKLIERASEDLDQILDDRGLGYVDGWDRGKRFSDGKIVSNVFVKALDGELGAVACMAGLRVRGSDPQRATIGYRGANEDEWTLRYERTSGKLPGPFSL